MLDPYNNREQLEAYAKAGAVSFAMELLPRTTRAQAMDVLSSQATPPATGPWSTPWLAAAACCR